MQTAQHNTHCARGCGASVNRSSASANRGSAAVHRSNVSENGSSASVNGSSASGNGSRAGGRPWAGPARLAPVGCCTRQPPSVNTRA
eukprot:2346358-Rhodomonas_salina.1